MSDDVALFAGTRQGLFRFDGRSLLEAMATAAEPVVVEFQGRIIQALAGTSSRPDRVFVALADGLYRSKARSGGFERVFEADVRSITIDPSDDDVVYVGTDPVHLYRSVDGGDRWEELVALQELPEQTHRRLGETVPNDMARNAEPGFRHRRQEWWIHPPYHGHILQVFVHPFDPRIIVCAIEHGGVAYSADGGEAWQDASDGIDYLDIHFIAALGTSPARWCCTSARGLFVSADPLAGWQRSERGCARSYFHDLLVTGGADPSMLVATADGSPGEWRRHARGARAALYRSDDLGDTWERVGIGRGLPEQMDAMVWALSAHPTRPEVIFGALGESSSVPNPARPVGTGAVIASEDGALSWRTVRAQLPAVEHLLTLAT